MEAIDHVPGRLDKQRRQPKCGKQPRPEQDPSKVAASSDSNRDANRIDVLTARFSRRFPNSQKARENLLVAAEAALAAGIEAAKEFGEVTGFINYKQAWMDVTLAANGSGIGAVQVPGVIAISKDVGLGQSTELFE